MKHVLVAIIVILCSVSCTTTTGLVTGDIRAAGQLEATVSALDRTVVNSRERVRGIVSASRDVENGIERLEYLFRCYAQEVERILYEIGTVRDEIKRAEEVDAARHNYDSSYHPGEDYRDNTKGKRD